MTILVKGSVARGRAPLPFYAYVINYARGGAVELYGQSLSHFYFSKLGSILKKRFI